MKSGDYSQFQGKGLYAEGDKYMFLRAENNLVLGKKKDKGSLSLQKSKTGENVYSVVIIYTKRHKSE